MICHGILQSVMQLFIGVAIHRPLADGTVTDRFWAKPKVTCFLRRFAVQKTVGEFGGTAIVIYEGSVHRAEVFGGEVDVSLLTGPPRLAPLLFFGHLGDRLPCLERRTGAAGDCLVVSARNRFGH